MSFKYIIECLVCGNKNLEQLIDLGVQPLVNNLKDNPRIKDEFYPMKVNFCPLCTHKQLSIAVDPGLLYSNYLYQTGASDSHKEFFKDFVKSLGPGGSVLDIGCNDGTLLKAFQDAEYNWELTGIDPANNLCEVAYSKLNRNAYIINDFYPTDQLECHIFHCIVAFNVFAHNIDPRAFLTQIKANLQPNGRAYILTTPARLENYYHEHISYFTPQSMCTLAGLCGLEVKSFKQVSMHNGGYLFELGHAPNDLTGKYFNISINNMVGYGASAGGTVLLNYFNLKLEYVIDDNPLKQGKYIPGINCPIYSSDHLANDSRDLNIVISAVNLYNEIVYKIKKLRPDHNDKFINLLDYSK